MSSIEKGGLEATENIESEEAISALVDSYLTADTEQEQDAFLVDLQQLAKKSPLIFEIIDRKKNELIDFQKATGETTMIQAKTAEEILADSEMVEAKLAKLEQLSSLLG